MISGMHVRHDWRNWTDDYNQNTIMSLCGRRTKVHLAGIPGMTMQPITVTKGSVNKLGWCRACMRDLAIQLRGWGEKQREFTSDIVIPCYVSAALVAKGYFDVAPSLQYLPNPDVVDPVAEKWLG